MMHRKNNKSSSTIILLIDLILFSYINYNIHRKLSRVKNSWIKKTNLYTEILFKCVLYPDLLMNLLIGANLSFILIRVSLAKLISLPVLYVANIWRPGISSCTDTALSGYQVIPWLSGALEFQFLCLEKFMLGYHWTNMPCYISNSQRVIILLMELLWCKMRKCFTQAQ